MRVTFEEAKFISSLLMIIFRAIYNRNSNQRTNVANYSSIGIKQAKLQQLCYLILAQSAFLLKLCSVQNIEIIDIDN
jgi:hypothetical protein